MHVTTRRANDIALLPAGSRAHAHLASLAAADHRRCQSSPPLTKVSGEAADSTATTRGGTGGATQHLGSSSGIRRAQTLPPRLECEEEVTSGDY